MKSLKELYTIGSGPSSSHTMGPERAARYMMERFPDARYAVTLYGSLALTGKGHLTDDILRRTFHDGDLQICFDWKTPVPHPNTLDIAAYRGETLLGKRRFFSVGGGALEIEGGEKEEAKDVYPFRSFTDIRAFAQERSLSLSELVYLFEGRKIRGYLEQVLLVMEQAIGRGLSTSGELPGKLHLQRKASSLREPKKEGELPEVTCRRIVSSYAYAVSEENAAGGCIVTAPTCGACGVLPAVLFYLKRRDDIHKEALIDALAVASVFGNLIKQNACISGAYAGCQAEIGSACSMAAAAASFLRGGTLDEIECAAEIAMEHNLGLTCDPVGGLVQIPCIERNAVAALRALDAATLAEFLVSSRKISFDTVIRAMYETGRDLKQDYRETATGGLAKNYKC